MSMSKAIVFGVFASLESALVAGGEEVTTIEANSCSRYVKCPKWTFPRGVTDDRITHGASRISWD